MIPIARYGAHSIRAGFTRRPVFFFRVKFHLLKQHDDNAVHDRGNYKKHPYALVADRKFFYGHKKFIYFIGYTGKSHKGKPLHYMYQCKKNLWEPGC